MSEPRPTATDDGASAEAPANPGGFFSNLFDLYFEPSQAFARIFVKPRLVVIILMQVALTLAFTTIWFQKMDARAFMKAQIEQNPRAMEMPAERIDAIIEAQVRFMGTWGRIGPLIAPLLIDVVLAGFFMFVFRFFIAADVTFVQALAVIAWSFFARGLVETPMMLSIMALKGDWNLDPNSVIQANPMAFFEASDVPRWLSAILSSFDLLSFWLIFLLATGYSVASKRSLSTGLWGVGIPWGLMICVKVAFRLIVG